MTAEKTVSEAINYRRSVRIFDDKIPLDPDIVKKCIEQAVLAPNSSNMQLWEFYHVTSLEMIKRIAPLCFNQNAAKTAQQLVIVVVRKDLWSERAKANLNHLDKIFTPKPKNEQSRREKFAKNYYQKLIPTIYRDFFGIAGYFKFIMMLFIGVFKPIYREVRREDIRVVAHKSAALAAQNFMLSMAAQGYDTCPMEGSDTWRVKKIMNIPSNGEINMIISCGVRKKEGIYGERFRIPFTEVYHHI